MKTLLTLTGLIIFSAAWSQKNYFFGSADFHKENPELVVIVQNPQSDLAKTLGSRYYNDTSFIRKLSEKFCFETSGNGDTLEESAYFCGHDLFFYTKKNNNLRLIRAINSDCESYLAGSSNENNRNKNLDLLLHSGIPLHIDTLRKEVFAETKDSIFKRVLFLRDVGIADGNITSEKILFPDELDYYNAVNFPFWYYDGKIEQTVYFNDQLTIHQNMNTHLLALGIDSVEFKAINWQINSSDLREIENNDKSKKYIRVVFLMSNELFSFFDNRHIYCPVPQLHTNFKPNSDRTLLLYRIPE